MSSILTNNLAQVGTTGIEDIYFPDLTGKFSSGKPFGHQSKTFANITYLLTNKKMIVHPEDNFPVNLIAPDLRTGPWIAGGAPLEWFQGKPVGLSDIDVFCKDEKQFSQVLGRLTQNNIISSFVFRSNNAITMELCPPVSGQIPDDLKYITAKSWRIQIINHKFYTSPEDVINNFDISVCRIVTDGDKFILGEDTAKHIHNRTLTFKRQNPNTLKRLIKYWSYGYEPDLETLSYFLNQPNNLNWNFNSVDDDYENLIP